MEIQRKFNNKAKSVCLWFAILVACQNDTTNKHPVLQKSKLFYQKDDVEVILHFEDKNRMVFDLSIDSFGIRNLKNTANLVLVQGSDDEWVVPEGTNRIDYNNPHDIIGIKCNSTYAFRNDTLHVVISLENQSYKRLDLQLQVDGKIRKSLSKTLILISSNEVK